MQVGRYVVVRAIWLTRRWLDTSLRSDGLKGWRDNTSLRSSGTSVKQQQRKGDDDERGLLPLLCLTFGSVTTIVGVCMLMEHDGMDLAGFMRWLFEGEPLPYPLCPLLGECADSQNVTASNCTL